MIFAISYLFFTIVLPGFSVKTEKNLKHFSMKVIYLLVYGGNDVGDGPDSPNSFVGEYSVWHQDVEKRANEQSWIGRCIMLMCSK